MSSKRYVPEQMPLPEAVMSTQKGNIWNLGEGLLVSLGGLVLIAAIILYIPIWLPQAIRDEMKR